MKTTKLYPPDDPETAAKVGIPRQGERFTEDDARRLVGAGLARRKAPAKPKTKAPAKPAVEG